MYQVCHFLSTTSNRIREIDSARRKDPLIRELDRRRQHRSVLGKRQTTDRSRCRLPLRMDVLRLVCVVFLFGSDSKTDDRLSRSQLRPPQSFHRGN